MRNKDLLKVLDVLYDTALERESWPSVLEALAAPVGGVTGHLLNWDKQSGLIPHYDVFSMDNTAMESYASQWVLEDPRSAFLQRNPAAQIFYDEMYISPEQKKRQAYFNEWEHKDTAQRYIVGRRVYQSAEREIIFSVGFSDPHGSNSRQAVAMFEQLGKHLLRAIEINQLFGRHLVKQTPELRILDSLNFGVVFLDELGRPGYYNRVAEQISERGDGLRLASNGLRALDGQSHSRLESIIRSCRQRGDVENPAGGWVSVRREDAGADYSLLVIPMPNIDATQLFSSPRVLVLISDPAEGREDVGAALRSLYGLTEGEARVCLSLVAGNDTGSIADELSVSREAVRFHLKNIYSKTGTNRQGELIRLILSLPSSPGAIH